MKKARSHLIAGKIIHGWSWTPQSEKLLKKLLNSFRIFYAFSRTLDRRQSPKRPRLICPKVNTRKQECVTRPSQKFVRVASFLRALLRPRCTRFLRPPRKLWKQLLVALVKTARVGVFLQFLPLPFSICFVCFVSVPLFCVHRVFLQFFLVPHPFPHRFYFVDILHYQVVMA